MKIQFEPGDKKYMYIGICIIGLIVFSAFQWKRNSGLRSKIKENNSEIKLLQEEKKSLLTNVQLMEEEKNILLKRADSFEVKETYYKYKFYSTNEKLKKTLATYSSADLDGKNELFTGDLSN